MQGGSKCEKIGKILVKYYGIALNLFYEAQVDSRTIGKVLRKINYKGVCRIDYFSADILNELTEVSRVICKS